MIHEEFQKGIEVLQAAFRRRYSDQSIALFWEELREIDGPAFIVACRVMARGEDRLPSLSTIFRNLPQKEKAEVAESLYGLPWLDEVRKVYNDCTAYTTQEERVAFRDKLDAKGKTLLTHGVILYETVWPQVLAEHPDWSREAQINEALKRFESSLYRHFNPPKQKQAEAR